jgi:cytolysin-activating lysine-acyltransferase
MLWLMGRDPVRREMRVGELDWRLMPPLVLDQMQIVTRFDVPWGFCTWAFVSEAVHGRLSSPQAQIDPHEWHGGPIPWIIEVCAPFGGADEVVQSALKAMNASQPVHAWMPGAECPELRTLTVNA